jgi:oxygen-independent coproporphyrinogen-3 oxidase
MILSPGQLKEKFKIREKSPRAGLYFHYPFCQKKCPYCHFYSYPGQREDHHLWLAAIQPEISLVAKQVSDLIEIDTAYFGGGTPSGLRPEEIEGLLSSLSENFNCSLEEITLEVNPGSHTRKLAGFKQAGINRLSLGAQSFSEKILKALGRLHSVEDIFAAARQARQAGFKNLNLDLMIGLPGEDESTFEANILGIKTIGPEHLSVYLLEELEEVPFKKVWEENPVPEEELARTYEKYQEWLAQLGYEQYEISNYCRPGFSCRHNLKYWEYQPVIGFGPSAASHLAFLRWQNIPDLKLWSGAILEGQMNLAEFLVLSQESALKEKLMSGLRLAAGVDWELIKEEYSGLDFLSYEEKISELAASGCLEIAGTRLRIPPGRFLVANSILSELLF